MEKVAVVGPFSYVRARLSELSKLGVTHCFLTIDEATRLINACRADLRELIKAALFTGARFSELTGLHVLDVNVGTASIYIKPAKSGKGRYVPLSLDGLNFFQEAILEDIDFIDINGAEDFHRVVGDIAHFESCVAGNFARRK